jgi:hypothetical protein
VIGEPRTANRTMMPKPGGARRAETICHQRISGGPRLICDEFVSRHHRTGGDISDRFNTRRRCPQAVGAPVIETLARDMRSEDLDHRRAQRSRVRIRCLIRAGIIELLRDREDRLRLYLLVPHAGT